MEVLAGYHKNLFVVGDPDQTIYTWRGADVRYLLDLDKRFPGTRTVMMLENYRSAPRVVAVANSLIEKNRERALRTEGSQERLDNLAELKQAVYEFETTCEEEVTLEHYLAHTALLTNADAMDDAQDKVRLMTVHAAKGLEFAHVFLCSMTEGALPSRKTDTPRTISFKAKLEQA